eukprot:gnl/TRDRNA2_/TRDRNA2_133739_c0_seq2.p1 gnl/TRDRNA2_/TRDRNA2_133739_c0~~gnl/TRDRNA2_/TRDRNA2_133739_c0_seq2.p1  ORF type:complete len:231 (-),score=14.97 gnl/TRDRNA2_/TRDRNA2_133739_c0_seq2:89-781(-)
MMMIMLCSSELLLNAWALRMHEHDPPLANAIGARIDQATDQSTDPSIASMKVKWSNVPTDRSMQGLSTEPSDKLPVDTNTSNITWLYFPNRNCRYHDDFDDSCDQIIAVSGTTCSYWHTANRCQASSGGDLNQIWSRTDIDAFPNLLVANQFEARSKCGLDSACKGFRVFTGSWFNSIGIQDKVQFFSGSGYTGAHPNICQANASFPTAAMLEDRTGSLHTLECWLKASQ